MLEVDRANKDLVAKLFADLVGGDRIEYLGDFHADDVWKFGEAAIERDRRVPLGVQDDAEVRGLDRLPAEGKHFLRSGGAGDAQHHVAAAKCFSLPQRVDRGRNRIAVAAASAEKNAVAR